MIKNWLWMIGKTTHKHYRTKKKLSRAFMETLVLNWPPGRSIMCFPYYGVASSGWETARVVTSVQHPWFIQRTNYGPQIITKSVTGENIENSARECLHPVTQNWLWIGLTVKEIKFHGPVSDTKTAQLQSFIHTPNYQLWMHFYTFQQICLVFWSIVHFLSNYYPLEEDWCVTFSHCEVYTHKWFVMKERFPSMEL